MIGALLRLLLYTFLGGYLFATFGYVAAISTSLTLKRTDDVILSKKKVEEDNNERVEEGPGR